GHVWVRPPQAAFDHVVRSRGVLGTLLLVALPAEVVVGPPLLKRSGGRVENLHMLRGRLCLPSGPATGPDLDPSPSTGSRTPPPAEAPSPSRSRDGHATAPPRPPRRPGCPSRSRRTSRRRCSAPLASTPAPGLPAGTR